MDHIQLNKDHWNKKVDIHIKSEFYAQDQFLKEINSLNQIELDLLGDVRDKKILHLQCHFGQDSLTLANMGAQVTAVDFSQEAIDFAVDTANQLELDVKFICSDVLRLGDILEEEFDIVFASYGIIGWHPDLKIWTQMVSRFVKPGGEYILVEFHPALWMWADDFSHVQYSYFNHQTIVEENNGTYADDQAIINSTAVTWNHALSDSIEPLIKAKFIINKLQEFDYSPIPCFDNIVKMKDGYQIKGMEGKLPMVFAIKASKSSL